MVDEVLQQHPAPTKHPCIANFSRLEGQKQRANNSEVVRLSSGKVRARLAPEGDEQVAPPDGACCFYGEGAGQGTSGSRSGSRSRIDGRRPPAAV
jgi:hypothetical protein